MKQFYTILFVLLLSGCASHFENKTYFDKDYLTITSGIAEEKIESLCFTLPTVSCFANKNGVFGYNASASETDYKTFGLGGAEFFGFSVNKTNINDNYQLIFITGAVQAATNSDREVQSIILSDGTNILSDFKAHKTSSKSEYEITRKTYTRYNGTTGFYNGLSLNSSESNSSILTANKEQAIKILSSDKITINYLSNTDGLQTVTISPNNSMRKVVSFDL